MLEVATLRVGFSENFSSENIFSGNMRMSEAGPQSEEYSRERRQCPCKDSELKAC